MVKNWSTKRRALSRMFYYQNAQWQRVRGRLFLSFENSRTSLETFNLTCPMSTVWIMYSSFYSNRSSRTVRVTKRETKYFRSRPGNAGLIEWKYCHTLRKGLSSKNLPVYLHLTRKVLSKANQLLTPKLFDTLSSWSNNFLSLQFAEYATRP